MVGPPGIAEDKFVYPCRLHGRRHVRQLAVRRQAFLRFYRDTQHLFLIVHRAYRFHIGGIDGGTRAKAAGIQQIILIRASHFHIAAARLTKYVADLQVVAEGLPLVSVGARDIQHGIPYNILPHQLEGGVYGIIAVGQTADFRM